MAVIQMYIMISSSKRFQFLQGLFSAERINAKRRGNITLHRKGEECRTEKIQPALTGQKVVQHHSIIIFLYLYFFDVHVDLFSFEVYRFMRTH
jgi:hypothetical protein